MATEKIRFSEKWVSRNALFINFVKNLSVAENNNFSFFELVKSKDGLIEHIAKVKIEPHRGH